MIWIPQYFFVKLFIFSFLSATLLPGGSEIYLYFLLNLKKNIILVLLVATAGNTIGSLINYMIGRWSKPLLYHKVIGFKKKTIRKSRVRFKKWGGLGLFLSFLPIVGDPLTAVAGIMNYPISKFILWVGLGKLVRYSFVLLVFYVRN